MVKSTHAHRGSQGPTLGAPFTVLANIANTPVCYPNLKGFTVDNKQKFLAAVATLADQYWSDLEADRKLPAGPIDLAAAAAMAHDFARAYVPVDVTDVADRLEAGSWSVQ
jgi:hypothetical protein